VAQILESKLDEVPVDRALDTLGLDSMMAFELREEIKQNLGLEVSLEIFLQNITLADLSALLIEKLALQARDNRSVVAHTETSSSGSEGGDFVEGAL
jgi:acyl carrier protein